MNKKKEAFYRSNNSIDIEDVYQNLVTSVTVLHWKYDKTVFSLCFYQCSTNPTPTSSRTCRVYFIKRSWDPDTAVWSCQNRGRSCKDSRESQDERYRHKSSSPCRGPWGRTVSEHRDRRCRYVRNGPVVILSKQGGVNIEDIAAKTPEAISYIPVNIMKGLTVKQVNKIVQKLGIEGNDKDIVGVIACNLYETFIKNDALLLEINPFALDLSGEYFALDCKCSFDDSAEFRQKKLFSFRDLTQEDPNELQASKFNLNYIALSGNIGCLVNGAGLAMATMDMIQLYGGMPANFLDVGGSATKETVTEAFKIIISDPKVEAILVNIFGGIMRCDIIAEGIIAASKELKLTVPVVVRLQGTNVEIARKLIADAQVKVFPVDEFATAAESAVKLSTIIQLASSMNLEVSFKLKKKKVKSSDCGTKAK
ncbi:succinate--CoA ligase [ADP-forming] subunit beta, mitochondrial-like isoform X2 [Ceratina calcarata]|uniref:Succinyl-CoA synthetase beta chain n=1 Tax=Ceratina calcarata TaxID=156304 RepID=A0AAJ7NDA6_9HYME|nr:succinate--CoA ligase [ADP-forming] subunit beta, mitochondrial-like isoform X2 [Ceratina calcarata]